MVDNAIIHSFPDAPYIARAAVYLRDGSRIRERVVLRDVAACKWFLARILPGIPSRVIIHRGGGEADV